ncbi:MAG: permease [Spirochaetes bacterium DG_61]|nr:MAG: permease [Spirochaetes bacterium DG_61]
MKEKTRLILFIVLFAALYFIPYRNSTVTRSILEAFLMLQEYVREHVLLCLIPAFFIAGAIAIFVSQGAVIKYFGAQSNKVLSYAVASVSGTILAVCSCTVLPIFAGIYKKGAGIGPATTFLYSGPAINVLAIILTARVLGLNIGIARAIGAIVFSVVIGLLMHLIFIKDEKQRSADPEFAQVEIEEEGRPLWQTAVYFFTMIAIIIFVNWGKDENMRIWNIIYRFKYFMTGAFILFLLYMIIAWFKKEELNNWVYSTWGFAKQILPLLFIGVLAAGFLLGRPGHEGVIPSRWVTRLVGGNTLQSNLFASVVGVFMYFATLTEVPILQGLLGAGMGKGPALALLLSGPALSLPNMLVIRNMLGTKKTVTFVMLVVVMATFSGMLFGHFFL